MSLVQLTLQSLYFVKKVQLCKYETILFFNDPLQFFLVIAGLGFYELGSVLQSFHHSVQKFPWDWLISFF